MACRLFIGNPKIQNIRLWKEGRETGRPVFGGELVPNLELYGAETNMDAYAIMFLYIAVFCYALPKEKVYVQHNRRMEPEKKLDFCVSSINIRRVTSA